MLFGVLSALAVFSGMLWFLPVVGIVLAVVSLRQNFRLGAAALGPRRGDGGPGLFGGVCHRRPRGLLLLSLEPPPGGAAVRSVVLRLSRRRQARIGLPALRNPRPPAPAGRQRLGRLFRGLRTAGNARRNGEAADHPRPAPVGPRPRGPLLRHRAANDRQRRRRRRPIVRRDVRLQGGEADVLRPPDHDAEPRSRAGIGVSGASPGWRAASCPSPRAARRRRSESTR